MSWIRNTGFYDSLPYLARFCNMSTNPVTANWCVRIYVVCVMDGRYVLGVPGGGGDQRPQSRHRLPALHRGDTEPAQLLPRTRHTGSRQHRQAHTFFSHPDHSRSVTTLYSQIHDYLCTVSYPRLYYRTSAESKLSLIIATGIGSYVPCKVQ